MIDVLDYGKKLEAIRVDKLLSRREFLSELGISDTVYQVLLGNRGRKSISYKSLRKIVDFIEKYELELSKKQN